MTNSQNSNMILDIKNILWPIEGKENKKFLPMAFMMFCILLNYSTLRSIKDGFVVPNIGPESLGFLKTYFVLPSAIIFMIVYSKLCNVLSQKNIFYAITGFFVVYLTVFTFVLYPYPNLVHPDAESIEALALEYPRLQWFIKIYGKWSFATFYVVAELWGSMMLSLLFWSFANKITKTNEAKRFYSMFGLLGNLGLVLTGYIFEDVLGDNPTFKSELKFTPIFLTTIFSAGAIIIAYTWMQLKVVNDPELCDLESSGGSKKKSKVKLSLVDSFKLIFSSKYLGLIAILVLAYGVSIVLVEAVWKSKINELYPASEDYARYMGNFQKWQGITAIIFMLIGSNVLRLASWKFSALLTPIMVFFTGLGFFMCIFFSDNVVGILSSIMVVQPLAMAVTIGMIQNILAKATKYSLFDSTKEMSYIPLDDELKTKGKAAVDVVGGRMGKSGGGVITSTFFILFPTLTFNDSMPYFAGIFFFIVLAWIFAVLGLSKEYEAKIKGE
jgi:ATP:ADP antiporter, AAA family